VLVLTLATYLLWHAKFRVLRYLVVVKLLAPLAAVLLVLAILGPTRRARLAAGLVLVACVAGIAVPDYGHGPWGDRLVSQTIPPPTGLGRAVVLIVSTPEGGGYLPLAAVPTAFPRGVRFADLTSHLCLLTRPTPTGPVPLRMREDVAALLDRHDGPIHLLTPRRSDPGAIARALGPHWLKPDEAPGNTIPVVVDGFDLLLRPVARIPRTALPCPADFDGDGRADRVVFRADLGWSFPWSPGRRIGGGPARPDLPAPADYDGDRRADPATFDPAEGLWRVPGRDPLSFGQGTLHGGDPLPVPADYDGDRRADPAVHQRASGLWTVLRSRDGAWAVTLGGSGSLPAPADFDGDGRADPAAYEPSTGRFEVLGSTSGPLAFTLAPGALPCPADLDGDGRADPAAFHPGTGVWEVQSTRDAPLRFRPSRHLPGLVPAPADYDGDGRADPVAFDPASGLWIEALP
jgi:hypothetical protein